MTPKEAYDRLNTLIEQDPPGFPDEVMRLFMRVRETALEDAAKVAEKYDRNNSASYIPDEIRKLKS